MPTFIVRVELHGVAPNSQEYEKLHEAMAAKRFVRTLPTVSGPLLELPPAEYYRSEEAMSLSRIRDDAQAAAAMTGKKYAILALEVVGIMEVGLIKKEDTNKIMNDFLRKTRDSF